MKIFLCGLPKSGRTTVAKAIARKFHYHYIDATSWVKDDFRDINVDEHPHQYEDEYQLYLNHIMINDPYFIYDHVYHYMNANKTKDPVFIIDGIISPKDFSELFDYKQDVVVFLNRTDNEYECRDHENIGVSVIRDYCFWMSSANLIEKKSWLEYNFRIPGDDCEYVKIMGARNSVFITKSIAKTINHLEEKIKELINK